MVDMSVWFSFFLFSSVFRLFFPKMLVGLFCCTSHTTHTDTHRTLEERKGGRGKRGGEKGRHPIELAGRAHERSTYNFLPVASPTFCLPDGGGHPSALARV
jgi:hypothetical protein